MALLLTILSVLALWLFLTVLVVGLLLILKTLESVRAFLEKITMGVRAIERQSDPLEERLGRAAASLRGAAAGLDAAAHRFGGVERALQARPGPGPRT